jgi:N-acetylmuramoyl-L-alanine amidase
MLVVIQAGHAGRTSGATGAPGEMAFNIAARNETIRLLTKYGIGARGINADVPNGSYAGDAFIAIHCDGGGPDQHGASVGYQSIGGEALATAWKHAYVGAGWSHGFHEDNYTENLHKYYGVRKAIEQGNRIACIIECGFVTSSFDMKIMTPMMVARSILKAIQATFNLPDTEEPDMELKDIEPGGKFRPVLKDITEGAVLDGIRRPTNEHPDRESLRDPLKELIKEAIREVTAETEDRP